jgi:NADH-quinone oxidoreductase subunit I
MFGTGVLKGLRVTLKEFIETYVDDVKRIPSRYAGGRGVIDQTQKLSEQTGLFTIQYPEERRKLPERFRYIPMLVYEAETGEDRCTACGICAKVCPPQCIWIVRDRDEKGKPVTRPSEFYIDASICMNCGLCAEFCPFDAIKMNHDFEISAYERMPRLVFTLQELRVPTTYYAKLRPTDFAEEEACRAAEAEKKAATRGAARPVAEGQPAAPVAAAPAAVPAKRSPEEIERLKAEVAAKRAAKAAEEQGAAPATTQESAGQAPAADPRKLSPEETARLRAEAAARRAAKANTEGESGAGTVAVAPDRPDASAGGSSAPSIGSKISPEELERRRAEALARHQARKAAEDAPDKQS